MTIDPSTFHRRLTLQRASHPLDAAGAPLLVLTDVVSLWCARADRDSREFRAGGQVVGEADCVFTFRFYPGLTSQFYLAHEGRTYNIIGQPLELERRRFSRCFAKARSDTVAEAGFTEARFQRSATTPAAPVDACPEGWSLTVPDGTDPLYLIRAAKNADGSLVTAWGAPQPVEEGS